MVSEAFGDVHMLSHLVGSEMCIRDRKKLGLAPPDSTDHEFHGTAVTLAARHDIAAKLLNKALDLCLSLIHI